MSENLIEGCPKYRYFERTIGVDEYIDEIGEVAIKPVGLTGGKGGKVVGHQLADLAEAKKYVRDVLVNGIGGGAVVIEQKLQGEEFTLMAFCDGENLVFMPTVQDHKRANDGDVGENTGGMGAYSDNSRLLPFLKNAEYEKACEIMRKIIKAQAKYEKFVGVLYGQFMTTAQGIYVIETNARFGDPEAMNVLSVLKSDLYDIFDLMAQKKLSEIQIDWEQKATVVKYLVPNGYPKKSVEPAPITIDYDALESCGAQIFFASVDEKDDGKIYSQKSRSIAVLAKADTIEKASDITEIGAQAINGSLWHRKDIGTKELLDKRIEHMKILRGE
jgi:phosphoribosylamine--glycine ligase